MSRKPLPEAENELEEFLGEVAAGRKFHEGDDREWPISRLTPAETNVLVEILPTPNGGALPQQDVGEKLFIDVKTVKSHVDHIYEKFRVDKGGSRITKLRQKLQAEFKPSLLPEEDLTPPPPQRSSIQFPPIPQWVGRDELLTLLQKDLQQGCQMLVLRGQGGIGKTSLAVKLMVACGIEPLTSTFAAGCSHDRGLFFKVGDSDGFDAVAAHFLAAFGLAASHDRASTPAQTIDTILARFQQERWLVVIDNLESLMEIDRPYAKSTDVGELLNRLAAIQHKSQIVLTSRKFPEDLYDRRGKSFNIGVIADQPIPGITPEASIQLLKDLGARDSQADLEWIAGRVGGNVYILGLLASYSRQKPGILRKKPELVTKEANPIVRAQWELQGAPAQDLLQRMCVLRIAMDVPALTTLRLLRSDGEAMEFTPEAEAATEDLLAGLVRSDLVQDLYDESLYESRFVLHPLMAETLRDIFTADLEELWRYAARLYGSFDLPEDEDGDLDVRSFEDMRFILEELHFYWLLEMGRNLSGSIVGFVLPKLGKWGYWSLQKEWLDRVLPYTEGIDYRICLQMLGGICRDTGKWGEAEDYFNRSLTHAKEENSDGGIAASLGLLGDIARNRGDYDNAEALYNQCLAVETELGDRAGMATSWGVLGDIARNRGDYDKAEALYNQSLAVRTELGDRAGMATSWGVLGDIARNRGDYDKAEALYNQSLAVETELGDRAGMATSWGVLGDIARKRGDYDKAEALYNQSLAVRTELGDRAGMATSWGSLGENELGRGNLDAAETLLRQALTVMEELQMLDTLAEVNWCFAQIYRAKGDEQQAQSHYSIAHGLYTKLGAKKDLERIESAWSADL